MPAGVVARTRAGTPGATRARCRSGSGRPTGESVLLAFWTSSALSSPRRVVAGIRRTGLVLRAGEHHERAGCREEPRRRCRRLPSGPSVTSGSSALQRHEDRAAALDGLVDAVVEELAEEREQRVVRRREADVGRDVRDEQGLVLRARSRPARRRCRRARVGRAREQARVALGAHREPGRRDRGRVGRGLVDDQVADRRAAAESKTLPFFCAYDVGVPAGPNAAGLCLGVAERPAWSAAGTAGRPQRTSPGRGTGCCRSRRPCADRRTVSAVRDLVRRRGRRACRSGSSAGVERRACALGDLDLLEDEGQVAGGDRESLPARATAPCTGAVIGVSPRAVSAPAVTTAVRARIDSRPFPSWKV